MSEFYVFDDEQTAKDAVAFIDSIGSLPLPSSCFRDGQVIEDSTGMLTWDVPRQRLDGKWVVQRISPVIRSQYAEHESTFDSNFPHTIEQFSYDWFELPNINY